MIRLEPGSARVVVGPRSALATSRIRLDDLNWLGGMPPGGVVDMPVAVRVRSTREPRARASDGRSGRGGCRGRSGHTGRRRLSGSGLRHLCR